MDAVEQALFGSSLSEPIARLCTVAGTDAVSQATSLALEELGLAAIQTPQELLDFAELVARTGGTLELIGRLLKQHALVRGASVFDQTTEVVGTL